MSQLFELIQPPQAVLADLRRNRRAILVVFGVLLSYVTVSSIAYWLAEDTTLPLSLYFTVINVTTVGFGDITPATGWGKLIAALNSIAGLVIFGFLVAAITMALQPRASSSPEVLSSQGGVADEISLGKLHEVARRFDFWMKHYTHPDVSVAESFRSFITHDPCIVEFGVSYDEYLRLRDVLRAMDYVVEWVVPRETFTFLVRMRVREAWLRS